MRKLICGWCDKKLKKVDFKENIAYKIFDGQEVIYYCSIKCEAEDFEDFSRNIGIPSRVDRNA